MTAIDGFDLRWCTGSLKSILPFGSVSKRPRFAHPLPWIDPSIRSAQSKMLWNIPTIRNLIVCRIKHNMTMDCTHIQREIRQLVEKCRLISLCRCLFAGNKRCHGYGRHLSTRRIPYFSQLGNEKSINNKSTQKNLSSFAHNRSGTLCPSSGRNEWLTIRLRGDSTGGDKWAVQKEGWAL